MWIETAALGVWPDEIAGFAVGVSVDGKQGH